MARGNRNRKGNKGKPANIKETVVINERAGPKAPSKPSHLRGAPLRRRGRNRGGGKGRAVPVARAAVRLRTGYKERRSGNDSVVIRGRDYIGPISTGSLGNAVGDNLFTLTLHPTNLTNSRVNTMAMLYEKYKFNKFVMHYEAAVPTTTQGSLIGAIIPDPDDPTIVGSNNIQQLASVAGENQCRVWDNKAFPLRSKKGVPFMYTQQNVSDPRLFSQGVFKLAAYTALAANLNLGTLYVEYEITFNGVSNQLYQLSKVAYKSGGTMTFNNPGASLDLLAPNVTVKFASNTSWQPIVTAAGVNGTYASISFQQNNFKTGDILAITGCLGGSTDPGVMSINGVGFSNTYSNSTYLNTVRLTFNQIQINDPTGYFSWYIPSSSASYVTNGFRLMINSVANNSIVIPSLTDSEKNLSSEAIEARFESMMEARLAELAKQYEFVKIASVQEDEPVRYAKCLYCGDPEPDHPGSKCPNKPPPQSGSLTNPVTGTPGSRRMAI